MNLKFKLDNFFTLYNKKITIREIIKTFNLKNNEIELLEQILYELEKEGKIYLDEYGYYMHVPKDFYLKKGILKKSNSNKFYINTEGGERITISKTPNNLKDGDVVFVYKSTKKFKHPKYVEGEIVRVVKKEHYVNSCNYLVKSILMKEGTKYYIKHNDKKIYIPFEYINTAYIGDLVTVSIENENIGKIIEIVKRHSNKHVFELIEKDGILKWVPVGTSYKEFKLNKKGFEIGDRIIAYINYDKLEFIKKIDYKNEIASEIETLIIDFGFDVNFNEEVIKETKKLSNQISYEELYGRVDLTNLETFTIDPTTAKDLDDAISLEYDNKKYRLYVHIADVSHYVDINSIIFKEALKRTTSIYPSNYVVPMLPEVLCNKLCSLNEGEVKLTKTCMIDIEKNGNIIDFQIFNSIIKNDKKMSYDEVNNVLLGKNIDSEYLEYFPKLLKMNELSKILQKIRLERGSIYVETDEPKFEFDEFGNPIFIKDYNRGEAEIMIENFMIIANETIATFAYNLDLPYIYRNHEKPTISKANKLEYDLVEKGYLVRKISNIDNPKILQQFFLTLFKGKNKEEIKYLSGIILKSMSRAFYGTKNIGHYGLALNCYGTFTSPIRKCSDLLNHMIINEFLENSIISSKMEVLRTIIDDYCEYFTEKQKDADNLEIEVNSYLLEKYAMNFIGSSLSAKIYFITNEEIYIKTANGINGLIPIKENFLLKGHFVVDKNNNIYKVGDTIEVTLEKIKNKKFIFKTNINNKKLQKEIKL